MRIGFPLGPAIFGCGGNPVANRRCSGGIPERFSGMGVSPEFLVFSACPVLPPAGVLSGVSSGGEVFSLVGGTTAELSISGMG